MNRKYASLILGAFAAMAMQEGTTTEGGTNTATPEVVPTAPNANAVMVKESFHFKKEKIRDDKGEVIGEGKKLPKAELYLPIPTPEYLVGILQGGEQTAKQRDLLMSALESIVYSQAREQINDIREKNKDIVAITQDKLNLDSLLWDYIANLPARERASSVPSDEDLQAFFESYLSVMPKTLEKDEGKIKNHINIFKEGFKKQRSNKPMLEVFKNFLAVYAQNVPEETLEEQGAVVTYYETKLDRMLKSEEKITMEDI
jgi:hypothetical protein